MSIESIPLSEGRGGLAEQHGFVNARALTFRNNGDGWVLNEWGNRHLAGNVVLWRRRNTNLGPKYHHEFVPIDSALLQIDKVGESINAEADRIGGSRADDGNWTSGELDDLSEARRQLGNWLTLGAEEKADIKSYFGGVAEVRSRAINPLNIAAGVRAAHMQDLKDKTGRDNPSAIMAMSQPLERSLEDRFTELVQKNLQVNNSRSARLARWIFEENRNLANANEVIDRLLNEKPGYDKYTLVGVVNYLKFRVQPFNMLGHELRQTGSNELDPALLEQVQQGLRFHRLNNYLLLPFRKLTSVNKGELQEGINRHRDEQLPAISERLEALESLGITEGPYWRLIGRLLAAGEEASAALEGSDVQTARKAAEQFKWLVHYLCMPGDDPEAETWYRYKLS